LLDMAQTSIYFLGCLFQIFDVFTPHLQLLTHEVKQLVVFF